MFAQFRSVFPGGGAAYSFHSAYNTMSYDRSCSRERGASIFIDYLSLSHGLMLVSVFRCPYKEGIECMKITSEKHILYAGRVDYGVGSEGVGIREGLRRLKWREGCFTSMDDR